MLGDVPGRLRVAHLNKVELVPGRTWLGLGVGVGVGLGLGLGSGLGLGLVGVRVRVRYQVERMPCRTDARPDDAPREDEEERDEVVPEFEAVSGAHIVVHQVEGHQRAESQHLDGQGQWHRRLSRRLARAPKAVAGRPVARFLALGVSSRPEPPGAP